MEKTHIKLLQYTNEESWDIKGGGGETGPVSQQTGDDSLIYTNSAMIDGVTVMLNYKLVVQHYSYAINHCTISVDQ